MYDNVLYIYTSYEISILGYHPISTYDKLYLTIQPEPISYKIFYHWNRPSKYVTTVTMYSTVCTSTSTSN